MHASRQRPVRMLLPHPRWRMALWWGGFILAAVAASLAVRRLYETVRRELHEQSVNARARSLAEAQQRIRSRLEMLRFAHAKSLASLHVEGLAHALQRWDEAEPAVIGTFQWEPARGFLPGIHLPPGVFGEDVARLWEEFRVWRQAHPSESARGPLLAGEFHGHVLRTLDHPALPAAELGYQAENLELLAYGRRTVDPWFGWAASATNLELPWIVWYRPGPDAPVRGAWIDPTPVLEEIRGAFGDTTLARLQLVPRSGPMPETGTRVSLEPDLPGYALVIDEGTVFAEKRTSARLAALAVVLLLAVFLLGTAALALYSRRETRAAARKAAFVTQVSHELRTPLTSIQMFADMLATPDLAAEKRARFAGTISRESQRLGELIERLLTFSTLEKSARPPPLATVDVTATTRETIEQMESTLQAAGLAVTADYPASPAWAETDRSALKQALLNLLDNARKYARAGGAVRLAVIRDASLVRVVVADEGPGIPAALGDRAFEPFVQGGQTLSDKSPGVGLGLSIARGLLRQAGGDLVLLPSTVGACFEIQLPAATA